MRFFNPENLFKKEERKEPVKPAGFEKFQESLIKQIETNNNNKIEIEYTGYRRFEHLYGQKLKEAGKIEIINKQGEQDKKFDFSSLLPKNWRFCERVTKGQVLSAGLNLLTSHYSKEIWFPDSYFDLESGKKTETFSRPEDLLGLLHEIGHSFESKETITKRITIKEKMKAKIGKLAGMKTEDLPAELFTEKEKQDYYQYIICPERDAWAFALRKCREAKRQGIDIFPKQASSEEILKIVRHCLCSALDAGIGIMKDPLEDSETMKIKREAIKGSKKLKSCWGEFKNGVIAGIIDKLR